MLSFKLDGTLERAISDLLGYGKHILLRLILTVLPALLSEYIFHIRAHERQHGLENALKQAGEQVLLLAEHDLDPVALLGRREARGTVIRDYGKLRLRCEIFEEALP